MAAARTLVEGVDFDAMGPELYRDAGVRIVASGGIPVYTAVGYEGGIGYGIDPEEICGPGKGLKTYDRLREERFDPAKIGSSLRHFPRQLAALNKGYYNSENALDPKAEIGELSPAMLNKTSRLPKGERALVRDKLLKSASRISRIERDPLYGSHIYLRAPSVWPLVEVDGKITFTPDLRGKTLQDFYGGKPYRYLMQGGTPSDLSSAGVIINVDPNATLVYNSETRVSSGYTGEIIYGSAITLSEYLLRLRDNGVGFIEPGMEIYATPADGFLPSSTFSVCIAKKYEDVNTKWLPVFYLTNMRDGSVSRVVGDFRTDTPAILKLLNEVGMKNYKARGFRIKKVGSWVNEGLHAIELAVALLTEPYAIPPKYEPIRPLIEETQRLAASLTPLVSEFRRVYPYVYPVVSIAPPAVQEEAAKQLKALDPIKPPGDIYDDNVSAFHWMSLLAIYNEALERLEENPDLKSVAENSRLGKIMQRLTLLQQGRDPINKFLATLQPAGGAAAAGGGGGMQWNVGRGRTTRRGNSGNRNRSRSRSSNRNNRGATRRTNRGAGGYGATTGY